MMELLLFAIIAISLSAFTFFIFESYWGEEMIQFSDQMIEQPLDLLAFIYLPSVFVTLLAIWLVHGVILKREESVLGLNKKGLFTQFSFGWLMGMSLVIFGFLLLLITDQIDIINYEVKWALIGGFLLMFVIQSFTEELLFRSYLLPTIEYRLGTWAALLLSSFAFMLIHVGNAGVSLIGCLNIFLAGILMGLLFIKFRNVWAPTALHISWNYVQSTILGFEVSGIKTYSWLQIDEKGTDLLTGGDFGYEGSIISVLFLSLSILYIWKRSPNF